MCASRSPIYTTRGNGGSIDQKTYSYCILNYFSNFRHHISCIAECFALSEWASVIICSDFAEYKQRIMKTSRTTVCIRSNQSCNKISANPESC